MSTKHTAEQKAQVFNMLEAGAPVPEIVKATGVPRSTIYFWKKAANDPKPEQSVPPRRTVEARLSELEDKLKQLESWRDEVDPKPEQASLEDKLTLVLEEILPWARRKMREEAKERERRESEDDTPRLVLGRKPVK